MAFTLDPQTGKITFGVVADSTHDAIARDIAQEFGVSEDFKEDFVTPATWTTTDATALDVDTINEELDFDLITLTTSNAGIAHDLVTPISDTLWVLRFKLDLRTFTVNTDPTGQSIHIGIGDSDQTVFSNIAQDWLGFKMSTAGNTSSYQVVGANGVGPDTGGAVVDTFTRTPTSEVVYVELRRTSATTLETNMFSDDTYTSLLESQSSTISASTIGLQYIKVMAKNVDGTGNGDILGAIDDIQLWDGITVPVITSSNWRMRFELDLTTLTTPTGNDVSMWISMSDSDETFGSDDAQDAFSLAVFVDNVLNRFNVQTSDNQTPRTSGSDQTMAEIPAVDTYFIEMIRDSASQTTVRFYTDNTYTTIIESKTQAGISGTDNLKYLKLFNDEVPTNTNEIDGTFDNFTFDNIIVVVTEQTSEVNALLQATFEKEFIVNALLQAQGANGACPTGAEAVSTVLDNIDAWDTQVNTPSSGTKIGQRWTPTSNEVALLGNGITKVNLWHGHTGGTGSFDTFIWNNASVGTSSETEVADGGTFNFAGSSSSISKRNRTLFDVPPVSPTPFLPTAGVEYVIGIEQNFSGTAQSRKTAGDTTNGIFTSRTSAGNWTDGTGDWAIQLTALGTGLGQGDQNFCISADGRLLLLQTHDFFVDALIQAQGVNGGCDTVILGLPFGSRSEQTSTFSPGIGGGTSWGEGAGIRFTPDVTMKIRAIEWNSTKGGGFQSGQVRCQVYTGVPTSGNITSASVTLIPGQQSFNTDDPHGGNEGSLSQFITFWATGSQKRRNEFLNVPASSNTSGVGGFLELDAGTEYVFMLREVDVGTGWSISTTTGGNSNQSALDVSGVRLEHWNNVVNPNTAEVLDLSPDDFAVDFEIETNKTAGCAEVNALLQTQGICNEQTVLFDQIAGNSGLWTSNTSQIVIDSGASGIVEMNSLVGGGTTTSRRATRALDSSFPANTGKITLRQKITKLASTTPTAIFMAIQNGTGDASLVGSSPRIYIAFGTGAPTGLFAHVSDGTNFVNTPQPQIVMVDGVAQFVETIYDPVAQTLTLNSYSDAGFSVHVAGSPLVVDASIISMTSTLIDTVVSSNFTNAGAGRIMSADLDDYTVITGGCPSVQVDAILDQPLVTIDKEFIVNSILIVRKTHDFIVKALLKATFDKEFIVDSIVRYAQGSFVGTYGAIPDLIIRVLRENGTLTGDQIVDEINIITSDPAEGFPFVGKTSRIKNWLNRLRLDDLILDDGSNPDWYRTNWSLNPAVFP